MPINKSLTPVKLPMELKFGQEPKTKFYNTKLYTKGKDY